MKIHVNTCRKIPWGIQVGRTNIVWWDLWTKRPCWEVTRVRKNPGRTPTGTGWPS